MAVNPNLAALMRVIEEYQDKIPEGEYLEAMNALGALHREIPAPVVHVPSAPVQVGHPPSYNASVHLFAAPVPRRVLPPGMEGNITEERAWKVVKTHHPDPYQNRISAEEWVGLPYETRYRYLREATECYVGAREIIYRNPDPHVCPFITRHAVGVWSVSDENSMWECVCGYTGKPKNWKKHEESERHQEWARHRTVSRRKIEKMKAMINDDEAGTFVRFASYGAPSNIYPGGIRYYTVWQDKNEWTHPELFAPFHRSPIPAKDDISHPTWFVHERNLWARQYVQ